MWVLVILALAGGIFFLATRKGFKSYKASGMWQDYHGIYTTFEPADLKLYRKLLPDILDMPDQPLVTLFVVDYVTVVPFPMSPYLEGSVAIKCKYKGEDGWHILSMPVTTTVANIAGRLIGFPKYVADEVALIKKDPGTIGVVRHKGSVKLSLEYTPGLGREITDEEKRIIELGAVGAEEPRFLLVPPAKGPVLKRVIMAERVPTKWEKETGVVKIHIKPDDPWAGLVAAGAEKVGQFNHFVGGKIMLNKKVN